MKKRALSVNDILCYEPKSIGFDGKWKEAMGDPELKGCWTIWGDPGQGKTRFLLQLTKYLMSKGVKVAYNSLEEGLSDTFKRGKQVKTTHKDKTLCVVFSLCNHSKF